MLRRLLAGRGFYIGLMFHEAAERNGRTDIVLDQPLQLAPEDGTSFTVARLAELIGTLGARLRAAGVRPGDRVALHKTENFDIVLLACAISRIGAVPALLSPTLDGATATELLRRLDRPWLVTDGDRFDAALAGAPLAEVTRAVLLSCGGTRPGTTPLPVQDEPREAEPVLLHPRQPTLITHSSGTTGVPKLVVHSAEALWHRLLPQKLWSWPMRGRKAAFCVSFVHSRFYHALGVFLHYGSPMVIAVDPAPDKIGPLFARTRPQVVETHPNTYVEWEQLADAQDRPLGAVRFYTGTFDAMHPRTIQRLLSASRQRNPLFLAFYGQSETGPVAGRWYTRRSAGSADGRCVGRSLPGFTRVRITSPAGGRAATGATGHIEVRSRSRAVTYLGEDARWQSQLSGGWWRMGDMGYKDRLGFLHLLDREADRIATVDSNLEAEDVLMGRLPELREVVIVEGPGGEAVPVVCTRDERPLDMDRWRGAVADLAPMCDPVAFRFEELPRTGTWKIRRHQLSEMLRVVR